MSIKTHVTDSLRLHKAPSPWPRMVLCAMSVTLPLILGILLEEQRSSIYGSLLGFILILNDHFGPLKTRVLHLLTAFCFLATAFIIGLVVAKTPWLLVPLLFLMAFILGKSKGHGLELERLVLFSTFQLLNAALTPELQKNSFALLKYASISFANYLFCLCLVYLTLKHESNFQKSKRQEFREAISKNETNRYSYTLAGVSCFGLLVGQYFHVERTQWLIGTILIVMMPNTTLSYQRSFQRLVGTFLGVLISSILLFVEKAPITLIGFSALAAFLAPLGLIRNYWLGNMFIAALIMFFLEFASIGTRHDEFAFAWLRMIDIGLGCSIGTIGTLIAFPHSLDRFFKK